MMKALIPISNMFFPFYFIPISNNEDIKEKNRTINKKNLFDCIFSLIIGPSIFLEKY